MPGIWESGNHPTMGASCCVFGTPRAALYGTLYSAPGLGFVRVVSDISPRTDPTRQYPAQEHLKSDPILQKSCGSQLQSGTDAASEEKGPVPTGVLGRVPESYPDMKWEVALQINDLQVPRFTPPSV